MDEQAGRQAILSHAIGTANWCEQAAADLAKPIAACRAGHPVDPQQMADLMVTMQEFLRRSAGQHMLVGVLVTPSPSLSVVARVLLWWLRRSKSAGPRGG